MSLLEKVFLNQSEAFPAISATEPLIVSQTLYSGQKSYTNGFNYSIIILVLWSQAAPQLYSVLRFAQATPKVSFFFLKVSLSKTKSVDID